MNSLQQIKILRDINQDEEIMWNYGKDYWKGILQCLNIQSPIRIKVLEILDEFIKLEEELIKYDSDDRSRLVRSYNIV